MNGIPSSIFRSRALTTLLVFIASMGTAHAAGQGPTAVYNEAVKVINGVRHVQLPPLSNDDRVKFPAGLPPDKNTAESPQKAWALGIKWDTANRENRMGWIMVETEHGLVECTDLVYHPNQCRSSTYGTKVLSRVWMVLLKGKWLVCASPKKVDKRNTCGLVLQPREGDLSFLPTASRPLTEQ